LADIWVIIDVDQDAVLDAMLIIFLLGFTLEFVVQVIGFWRAYLFTFFFYMDLLGTFSLLLDISYFRENAGGKSGMGGNAVIMRAARAAKLGARAGRFTRLLKLLRFLPGFNGVIDDGSGPALSNAKGLTQLLVGKLSTRVSCLIIILVMVLPVFTMFTKPAQDFSMQVWTNQLADAFRENWSEQEVADLIVDFRFFFREKNYIPHSYRLGQGDVVYWRSHKPLHPSHELPVVAGNLIIYFDFGGVNRVEAGTNTLLILFTIFLMSSFSLLISNSVSTIAVMPLESILSRVRDLSKTLYGNVEKMRKNMGSNENGDGMPGEDASETALLECVVQKLATIGEINMSKGKQDDAAMQYLGQTTYNMEDVRTTHEHRGVSSPPRRQRSYEDGFMPEFMSDGTRCPQTVCTWDFNPKRLSHAQSCTVTSAMLGHAAELLDCFAEDKLHSFTEEAALGYHPGPKYHSWGHAVDVSHVLFMMLHRCNRRGVFMSPLEEVALLVAAVCHDMGHFGVSNDFLVNTTHELAIRYNDHSPLENMSCARLFEIANKPRSRLFGGLSTDQYRQVRLICVESILHTDNVHHVSMVKRLQLFAEMNSEMIQSAQALYFATKDLPEGCIIAVNESSWPPTELVDALWESESRMMLRNTFMHMADISNPTRPFEICKEWAACIMEEFFEQGDLERKKGLPIGPLNDREKTNFPLSQVSFIEFFVAPLALATVRVLAPLEALVETLVVNSRLWAMEWVEDMAPTQEELQKMEERMRRLEEKATLVTSVISANQPPSARSSAVAHHSSMASMASMSSRAAKTIGTTSPGQYLSPKRNSWRSDTHNSSSSRQTDTLSPKNSPLLQGKGDLSFNFSNFSKE
jgi:hypothetical protein